MGIAILLEFQIKGACFLAENLIKKMGKKRKREIESKDVEEAEGSGSGCSSYLHLRLDLEGEVDRSPGYMRDTVTMALK